MALLREVIRTKLSFRHYGNGTPHMVNDFESEARNYFHVPYALATTSGSGAIFCAIVGLGMGPGDEIIIPSLSWYTCFNAPVLFGVLPVFADIDRSLTMDPDSFEQKITPNTKAVMVVHYQGGTGDMERILETARRHNIKVIEDSAQACGATYRGKKVGTLGDVGCFSFQQNKIMCTGEGGLLLARDRRVFERAVRFHDLGVMREVFEAQMEGKVTEGDFTGCQFRMSEFTGAVALAQLRKLDKSILDITRRYHKNLRNRVLSECPGMKLRKAGDPEGDAGITFFMDMETPEQAEWFVKALSAEGIRVSPTSGCCNLLREKFVQDKRQVHPALPPFGAGWQGENVRYTPEQCPKTDEIFASMACVPLCPAMTDSDINDIGTAIVKVWDHFKQKKESLYAAKTNQ
jgi:8-amino-3,8-dideoxy-alpha-D-manno-octulosonate transaminase